MANLLVELKEEGVWEGAKRMVLEMLVALLQCVFQPALLQVATVEPC